MQRGVSRTGAKHAHHRADRPGPARRSPAPALRSQDDEERLRDAAAALDPGGAANLTLPEAAPRSRRFRPHALAFLN